MGVSFKMRKRRETGKNSANGGQRRRAARLHQSLPCFALRGYSREPLRPPRPIPKADRWAATSSFLYFERDPHGPDNHPRAAPFRGPPGTDSPRRCSAPMSMLSCACPVMNIKVLGAFKTHLRPYCGPGKRPPGVIRLSSVWQRIYDSGHRFQENKGRDGALLMCFASGD
jgi:hypothetical protein